MKDYIYTYTKKLMNPLDPKVEDISVNDIAHALSFLTRANGHIAHFYSVAQHSINCCIEARAQGYSPKVQLGCLLHDAPEAYLSDIIRPIKNRLRSYLTFEKQLFTVIWEALGIGELSKAEWANVMQIDDAMLYFEFDALHDVFGVKEPDALKGSPDFDEQPMVRVESQFLEEYKKLYHQLAHA